MNKCCSIKNCLFKKNCYDRNNLTGSKNELAGHNLPAGRLLPTHAIENALRALFCEKNGFNTGVNGRGLGRFSFRPKSPQKGWGHLKHDFRLTERLLPDSTMTYRGRSDGLVVESDRKNVLHSNLHVIYATYKDIAFIH